MNQVINRTERTSLKRLPKRGEYNREVIYSILDEALVCHVGFAVEGKTFVVPTGYAREGDNLLIHGSSASRMLKTLSGGIEVCVTVTLLDGLVLARSAFHHSMNYRSVMIFGKAFAVSEENEKMKALRAFSEHIVKGRWQEVRSPTSKELKGTLVLALPLQEASAKIRNGSPVDDETDYELNVWAGEIPLQLVAGAPIDDPRLTSDINQPDYARNYTRVKRSGNE
ncbi:MAG TPA: pyridoxamine 5'-phosphate oxidase family protein [Pyrinomonadaceae bacterium]|jgi:nitroimidazol reductase NimA-like FMN-containing flavoprotein (pyridoxamine 5'-phosphate oxidase superfamily)